MKNIVIAVDFSDVTHPVTKQAISLGRLFGAQIFVVHVAKADSDHAVAEGQVKAIADTIKKSDVATTSFVITGSDVVESLTSFIQTIPADLVIMGTHGQGLAENLFLGSVSQGILEKSPCPTLIIPSNPNNQNTEVS